MELPHNISRRMEDMKLQPHHTTPWGYEASPIRAPVACMKLQHPTIPHWREVGRYEAPPYRTSEKPPRMHSRSPGRLIPSPPITPDRSPLSNYIPHPVHHPTTSLLVFPNQLRSLLRLPSSPIPIFYVSVSVSISLPCLCPRSVLNPLAVSIP